MICCTKIWLLNKEDDWLYDRYVPAGKNASLDKKTCVLRVKTLA